MNELSLFDSLFNGIDDFTLSYRPRTVSVPKVDVTENKDNYTLEMELPGRNENDVNIDIDHKTLTISSKTEEVKENGKEENEHKSKNTEKLPSKCKYLIRERITSSFARSFTLPEDVDNENISATFKNGILNVTMPRKALSSPKRIAISVA